MGRVAFASFIRTAIEFYDFYIYETAAALAFATVAGALLALLWAFPMFWLFDTGNPALITFAFSVGMLAFAVLYGPLGAYLPELFGTRLRYSAACSAGRSPR